MGLPKSVIENILLQRGFDADMATLLALKLGSVLPHVIDVPLKDPLSYVQRELFKEAKAVKKCFTLNANASAGTLFEKTSESCCNAFQMCLLTGNTLFYNPECDELRFASPLSLEAFNLVTGNYSLALSSPL
jgi:hypothetical protein